MINVQYCPCGHSDTSDDPEHIRLDEERAAKSYLDALILPSKDCPECRENAERPNWYHEAYGLPMEELDADSSNRNQ